MKSVSLLSPELRRFPKISKSTALFCNQVDGALVLWISSLNQACEALKISHSLIKFAFASYLSKLHISRRQVTVSLQIILTSEKEEKMNYSNIVIKLSKPFYKILRKINVK